MIDKGSKQKDTKCVTKESGKLWHACAFAAGIFVLVSIAVALHSQAPNKNEASCRAFVQQFYDWYLGQGCAWYDVAKLKPQVLNSKLLKLLKKEDATQTACKCIDHLDADPFLNSQDPDPKYVVKGVTVANGRCNATVKGAGEDAAEVRPELVLILLWPGSLSTSITVFTLKIETQSSFRTQI